jgi:ABC-2 type transport system ATP-binding protein
MAAIEARGLTKRYGPVEAVRDLSFTVEPGTVTGFLGPNGAGKSTTMRMILGLVAPDGGSASVLDGRYRDLPEPLKTVGAVLDGQAFHPRRRARSHLRALAAAAGIDRARVDEVLAQVELTDAAGRKAGQFSLGMKQRLALASALLGDPRVLILDEPANGLDPAGIRWLRRFLRAFADDGRTVFVSSHLLGEVAQLADDVVVIDRGRLVTQSTVAALTAGARTLEDVFLELTEENER